MGEEKWRSDRTSAPEGLLGGERGSHTWGDPQELRGLGGSVTSLSASQLAPGQVPHPPRPRLGHTGPRAIGGSEEEGKRRKLQPQTVLVQ